MQPNQLLKTIYLGDRACKGVYLNSWERRVDVHINCISRIRHPSGHWNYYTDEDIDEGRLVFNGVEQLSLTPPGLIPNDLINELTMSQIQNDGLFDATLLVDSVGSKGEAGLVTIVIRAKTFHLEDPSRAGVVIDS